MQYISRSLPAVPLYLYNTLLSLLHHCCHLWLTANQYQEMKKAEEESLYRYKSKVHTIDIPSDGVGGDNSKEDDLLKTMFPKFDHEFTADDGTRAERQGPGDDVEVDQCDLCQFTDEEMDRVVSLQSHLFTPNHQYTNNPTNHLYIVNMYRTAQDILNNRHNLSTIHSLTGVIQACNGMNNLLNSTISPTDRYANLLNSEL